MVMDKCEICPGAVKYVMEDLETQQEYNLCASCLQDTITLLDETDKSLNQVISKLKQRQLVYNIDELAQKGMTTRDP